MGKVEDALRDFIQYHSRRQARDVFDDTPDRVRDLKKKLRDLRNTVDDLEEKVDELLDAHRERMDIPPADEEVTEQSRVTKRTIESIRDRYNLTQQQLADLLDVSHGTVTSWENGKSKPQSRNKARIITLREMSRTDVDDILGREDEAADFDPDGMREFRDEMDLTQQQFGALLDVSETTVSNWENGETTPDPEQLEKFGALLDLDADQIHRKVAEATGLYTGDHLREVRDRLELSQGELAEALDVSPGTVSNWERDINTPGTNAVRKLRELLDA